MIHVSEEGKKVSYGVVIININQWLGVNQSDNRFTALIVIKRQIRYSVSLFMFLYVGVK